MAKKSNTKNFITVPTGMEAGTRAIKVLSRGAGALTGNIVANAVPQFVRAIPRKFAGIIPFAVGMGIEMFVNEGHEIGQHVCAYGQGMTVFGVLDGTKQNVSPGLQQKMMLADASQMTEIAGRSGMDEFPYDPVAFNEFAQDAEEVEVMDNNFAAVN